MKIISILFSTTTKNLVAAFNTIFKSESIPIADLEFTFKNNNYSSIQWKNSIQLKIEGVQNEKEKK